MALKNDKTVVVAGKGVFGQLGFDNTANQLTFTQPNGLTGQRRMMECTDANDLTTA